jgi:hypothetical protein
MRQEIDDQPNRFSAEMSFEAMRRIKKPRIALHGKFA